MKDSKLYAEFQRLGKVLMAPVLLLPVSGILVGLGSALSNANLIALWPFLGAEPMVIFSTLIKAAGNVINNNISVLFAICVAYGYAKAEKATAALSGFIGYMTMNTIMGNLLVLLGEIDPKNLQTGQSAILGVITLDTGVFGGIIIGLVVAWIHNRYYKVQLPPVLGIFNGTRCVPALTVLIASFVGIVLAFVFPFVQTGLKAASSLIDSTGAFGAFIYGFSERLLLPFGLHHFIYLPFFFTSLGGSIQVDGQTVEGAVNIYNAMLNTPGMMYNIDISKYVMNGKVLFAMCGLPAAALAMYRCALPENKKKVGSLMIAAVIPAAIMGITEPLEYSFLFVAPALYVAHAFLCGIAYVLTYIVQFNVPGPSAFGGPLLSWIFNGIMNADKGSNWYWLIPLGIAYFVIYYFMFKFLIKKFDMKTPGRELEAETETAAATADGKQATASKSGSSSASVDEIIPQIVEAVGGAENITGVNACFTRLRLTLADPTQIAEDSVFTSKLGASAIVHVGGGVQIVYGNKASVYKVEMREFLGLE